jgi:dolichyl-phosphate beta-glucosyltransferase
MTSTRPARLIAGWAAVVAGIGVLVARVVTRRRNHDRVTATLGHRRDRPPADGDVRFSVVVPAFREQHIGDTVVAIRRALADLDAAGELEVVVVDDGSHDGTDIRAHNAGADRVLRLAVNRGKGAAVRTGMLAARGRTVAFTDADLSYPPGQLAVVLDAVESGWDVVVGSRRHTDTTTLVRARRIRELGGRAINALTRAVLLGDHRDTQCGIKAFRSDAAQLIFGHAHIDGFAFDVEVFHLVERYGLSLTEVPVQVVNTQRSSVRVVRDAARLVRDLFRIRTWAATGVYEVDPVTALDPDGAEDQSTGT